jgi:hypothetical protein
MNTSRVKLFERLPEIYRIRDAEQAPPGQLEAYLDVIEQAFSALHENIEALYNDLFIDTCDNWVVAYLADLLGTSHLKGDPWTLRADVADTIALRRRKGTLRAIELLAFDLTKWAAHAVELRENLIWHQHLNHQRPDEGGKPPYGLPGIDRFVVRRGGTVPVRSPATLSLLNTPFDPFPHVADVRPPMVDGVRYNLPNLAIFLWRLEAYRVPVSRPLSKGATQLFGGAPPAGLAKYAVRFELHPLDRAVRLFNTYRFDANQRPPELSKLDEVPGPILPARLNSDSPAGNPDAYVTIDLYDSSNFTIDDLDVGDTGLQLYLPKSEFTKKWNRYVRGDNLCAWENGLRRPLRNREIVIDPDIGRVLFGVATAAQRTALIEDLWVGYTYAVVGPVGAHPISRPAAPKDLNGTPVTFQAVTAFPNTPTALAAALNNLPTAAQPIVIEIQDSLIHELDLNTVVGKLVQDGGPNLVLNQSLIIRAADGERPIIRLAQPLRFRLKDPNAPVEVQAQLIARLEGLYLTPSAAFPAGEPLIARAALGRLELLGCTLDPGGFRLRDGTRAPMRSGLRLRKPYGFAPADEKAFNAVPHILLQRTISGAVLIDDGYRLVVSDSILDAGAGVDDPPGAQFALTSATDPLNGWGAPTDVRGATFFGRVRVERMSGTGGIWVQRLEVHNNQTGCIKFSYFSGDADRLPLHFACVSGPESELKFTSEWFEQPGYAQLGLTSNKSILQLGPRYPNQRQDDGLFQPMDWAVPDAMGAFGFLLEAHKWINLQIRFREFMPVGVRPLLIPVT